MTPEEFFQGNEQAAELFRVVLTAIEIMGPVQIRVSKSQIAFRGKRGFAWVWIPGKYLKGKTAPLVLTIGLRRRDLSARWKEVVEPYPGRFVHHLELYAAKQVDEEVKAWLAEAWDLAG